MTKFEEDRQAVDTQLVGMQNQIRAGVAETSDLQRAVQGAKMIARLQDARNALAEASCIAEGLQGAKMIARLQAARCSLR
jgi:hypothetical protein